MGGALRVGNTVSMRHYSGTGAPVPDVTGVKWQGW
jgi:hypothetical protein